MTSMPDERYINSTTEPMSTSTTPTDSSTVTTVFSEELFNRHRVTKFDTLAGLAVKYNVSVADIKRANGFISDTAMFARETLLIPTRSLTAAPEYNAYSGMVFAHLNRIPARRSVPSQRHHNTTAVERLRGYYSTGPSPLDISPEPSDDEDDGEQHELLRALTHGGARKSNRKPVEVEMMARGSSAAAASEEKLRRRSRLIDDGGSGSDIEPSASGSVGLLHQRSYDSDDLRNAAAIAASCSGLQNPPIELPPRIPSGITQQKPAAAAVKWKDSLLYKLKRVTSQPVLATGKNSPTMANAADAVISFVRPSGGGAAGASSSMSQQMQQVVYSATKAPKESRKAD